MKEKTDPIDYYGKLTKRDIVSFFSKVQNSERIVRMNIDFTYPKRDTAVILSEFLQLEGNETILDAGCGTGHFLLEFSKKSSSDSLVIGMDLSSCALKHIKKGKGPEIENANIHLICSDLEFMPFARNYFDVILCNFVLHYTRKHEDIIRNFYNILNQHGVLVVSTHDIRTMRKELDIFHRALAKLGVNMPTIIRGKFFNCEVAERIMSKYFSRVNKVHDETLIVFPDINEFLMHFEATRGIKEKFLPREESWNKLAIVVEEIAKKHLDCEGKIVDKRIDCHIVARKT